MKYIKFPLARRGLRANSASVLLFSALAIFQAATVYSQVPIVTPKPTEPAKPAPVLRSRETDDKGNTREYIVTSTVGVAQFTEEINKLGKKGYRLQNVTISSPVGGAVAAETPEGRFSHLALAAIFRLDKPNSYEYDWFEAEIPGEIVTRINKRAESGFYYAHSVFFTDNGFCDGSADSSDPLDAVLALVCGSEGGIYFVERKNGETAKREYRVHIGRFGWGKNPTAELEAALDNSGQLGFRPVSLGKMHAGLKYAFYTLVEKDKGLEGEPIKTQYRFLKSEFGFSKKANAIIREGFRIKFGSQFGAFENMLFEKTEGPCCADNLPLG